MATLILVLAYNTTHAIAHLFLNITTYISNALHDHYFTIKNPKLRKLAQHTLFGDD